MVISDSKSRGSDTNDSKSTGSDTNDSKSTGSDSVNRWRHYIVIQSQNVATLP